MKANNYIAIGAAIVSLLGATTAWWQARRATMLDTKNRVGEALLKINQIFVDDPLLWPYFFEGKKPIPQAHEARAKAIATIMINIFEEIWSQRDGMTPAEERSWGSYIRHQVQSADIINVAYKRERDWYPNLQGLLEKSKI